MSPAALVLLFVLLAAPLVEIALLIQVASLIGAWPVLAIVIGTAILGFKLLRDQSFTMFERAFKGLAAGEPQVAPVLDGMFMMLAGMLLLAPGLITDLVGLLLLVPPVRRGVARLLLNGAIDLGGRNGSGGTGEERRTGGDDRARPRREGPTVIEGEFERLDERPIDPDRSKPSPPDRRR